jgi:hypothetical protein
MLLQTLHHIASSFGPLELFDRRPPEAGEDSPGELQVLNFACLSELDYRRVPNISGSSQCG